MAKVLYLHEVREDYSTIIFFKNKKNLEAAKVELDKPSEYQDQEDYDYNKENNIEFIREGDFSYSKGLALFAGDVGDGNFYAPYDGLEFRDMTEEQFRAQAEKHIEVFDAGDEQGPGGLLYYKGGIKEGTEIYMSSNSGIVTDKGTSPKIAIEDGSYSIGESVKTTFKYVPTFESFIGSQKLNEDTDWDACEGAQKDKFAPVCKALKCEYSDLVFFELLHNELGYYTEEEYEAAFEKGQELSMSSSKTTKDFVLKKIDEDGDPHGNMDGVIVSIKGTKLKYAYFDSDMNYSGTICSEKDIKALEAFYLDGKKASTKDGVKYATPMSDVYGEYCMDMGFENED